MMRIDNVLPVVSVVIGVIAIITLLLGAYWPNQSCTTTTEQMSEVRAAQRDCLQHSGAVFSVKTIWAGDPPVPVEYEITCQQEQAE